MSIGGATDGTGPTSNVSPGEGTAGETPKVNPSQAKPTTISSMGQLQRDFPEVAKGLMEYFFNEINNMCRKHDEKIKKLRKESERH